MKTIISMRADLAEEGMSVPASRTFSNYDTLDDDLYISAKELEGATYADDPADPDDHPFCYLELNDGRCLYFISADLDFETDDQPTDQELVNLALSVSSKCQWDGLAICAVFLEALTDANFHMLRERLEGAIKKELKIKSLYSIKE